MQGNNLEQINKVLRAIFLAKPKAPADQGFKQELRNKVMNRALEIERAQDVEQETSFWLVFWQYFKPAGFALAGAVCALIIVAPLLLNNSSEVVLGEPPTELFWAEKNTLAGEDVEESAARQEVGSDAGQDRVLNMDAAPGPTAEQQLEGLAAQMPGTEQCFKIEEMEKTKSNCVLLNKWLEYLDKYLKNACQYQE